MNPSKLAGNILKKIESENITPRSKYIFIAKNIIFWGLFLLALGVGAISFAIILYAMLHTDFAIGDFVETQSLLSQWISLLPLLWMLCIGIAVGLGIYGLKHTKRGYRIALITLIGGNVFTSIALGSGLYATGGAEIIEDTLEANFESYQSVREKHQRFWGYPESKGRLAGKVIAVNETKSLMTLEGPRGNQYQVPYGENFPLKEAPAIGTILKMKGRLEAGTKFKPNRLRRAEGQERMQKRIEEYLQRNPEIRAAAEAKLSPATKSELDATRNRGERPTPELRERIRTEIEQNTTLEERAAVKDKILEKAPLREQRLLPDRFPRLENRQELLNEPVDNPHWIR